MKEGIYLSVSHHKLKPSCLSLLCLHTDERFHSHLAPQSHLHGEVIPPSFRETSSDELSPLQHANALALSANLTGK